MPFLLGPGFNVYFTTCYLRAALKVVGLLAHPLDFPSMTFLLKKLPLVLIFLNFRLDANASDGWRLPCRGLRTRVMSDVPSPGCLSSASWATSDKSHALSRLPFLS